MTIYQFESGQNSVNHTVYSAFRGGTVKTAPTVDCLLCRDAKAIAAIASMAAMALALRPWSYAKAIAANGAMPKSLPRHHDIASLRCRDAAMKLAMSRCRHRGIAALRHRKLAMSRCRHDAGIATSRCRDAGIATSRHRKLAMG